MPCALSIFFSGQPDYQCTSPTSCRSPRRCETSSSTARHARDASTRMPPRTAQGQSCLQSRWCRPLCAGGRIPCTSSPCLAGISAAAPPQRSRRAAAASCASRAPLDSTPATAPRMATPKHSGRWCGRRSTTAGRRGRNPLAPRLSRAGAGRWPACRRTVPGTTGSASRAPGRPPLRGSARILRRPSRKRAPASHSRGNPCSAPAHSSP
mmetsp:Transcript_57296/g.153430  ORF Transcript_57296/g.153430 Transcript_57296/m.153430 type:complete len:209 (+) Transcript_57296:428-1054(+)